MRKELIALREKMRHHHIDAYMIPTTDFHLSEYVNDYFKCREFISGFTGSAGTLVVTHDEALLWTDGRYFLQAEAQLHGSGIRLMKMGQPDVPKINEYLTSKLTDTQTLAFDGRCFSVSEAETLSEKFNVVTDCDLVGEIWSDRPAIIPSKIYPLPDSVTGETSSSKLTRLREHMASKGADYHITSSLEEIAWLFNLRGSDIAHTPVFFAFALVTPDENRLYIMDQSFTETPTAVLHPYDRFMDDINHLPEGTMLLNKDTINYAIYNALPSHMKIIPGETPAALMKAIKNPAEIASTKKAHLKDGAAMVNFLYWLKTNIGHIQITEISASDHLERCRRQQGAFDRSFDTISGYGSNGAIVHYSATPETNKELKPEGLYLVDSGGQYEDGTTDITRTIALGPLTYEMKRHYTAVLKGHISLANAVFNPGTTGADLDPLARKPLHDIGLDYNHGTGHGVGHMLSCHEGPQTISPRGSKYPIEPGMINSNEPGVYIEGSHGIRLENEILCIRIAPYIPAAETGVLYGFETITFCPFDKDAIDANLLTTQELQWLNDYHQKVYEKISSLVNADVRGWLKDVTAPIHKK